MAVLYITEFGAQGRDQQNFIAPVATMPALVQQTVAISASSAASAAFGAQTAMIRIESDTTCSVIVGTAPTATTTSMRVAADSPEYFAIPMGQSFKIAVISNS
jgi:hypothetical protein